MGRKEDNNMLSEKEKIRLERFEKISADMQLQEYKRQDLTIDLKKANVLSMVLFMFLLITGSVLFFFCKSPAGIYQF